MTRHRLMFIAVAFFAALVTRSNCERVTTERFTVSLPVGFKAHAVQMKVPVTRWTYTREAVPSQSDYRFRVSVIDATKPIPEDHAGLLLAGAMVVDFTAQQSRVYTDMKS